MHQSVGNALIQETSLKKKELINKGIFSQLNDYANLPDEIDDATEFNKKD